MSLEIAVMAYYARQDTRRRIVSQESSAVPPTMYRISYDNDRVSHTRPSLEEAQALAQHHRENGWTDVKITPPHDQPT